MTDARIALSAIAVTAVSLVALMRSRPILTLRGTPGELATAERIITPLDARWDTERSGYCASVPGSRAVAARSIDRASEQRVGA
jgi:hypothetical protein